MRGEQIRRAGIARDDGIPQQVMFANETADILGTEMGQSQRPVAFGLVHHLGNQPFQPGCGRGRDKTVVEGTMPDFPIAQGRRIMRIIRQGCIGKPVRR